MRFFRFLLFFSFILILAFLWYLNKDKSSVNLLFKSDQKTIDCSLKTGVDGDICRFLSFQFPYSIDDVSKRLLVKPSLSITKLGLESLSRVEGIVFDYQYKEGDVLLIVGFDDKNGKRFISPLRVPVSIIKNQTSRIYLNIHKLENRNLDSKRVSLKVKSEVEINNNFNFIRGNVVVFMLMDEPITGADLVKAKDNEVELGFVHDVDNQLDNVRGLLKKVNGNGLNYQHESDKEDNAIVLIDYTDISKLEVKSIPVSIGMMIESKNESN